MKMNLWTVALTIYMNCCIQAVLPQGETVFSISFSTGGQTNYFNFSETMFNRFYHCLRNKDHTLCYAQRDNQYDVTSIKTCLPVGNSQKIDAFTCRPFGSDFICKGVNFPPPGVDESKCTFTYNIIDDASLSQQVRLTWDGVDSVTMENHAMAYGITVDSLGNNIYMISGEFTSKVTTNAMTTATVKTTRTHAPDQASTFSSLDFSTINTPVPDKQKSEDGGDDSDIAIIIGATVAGVVIVAIIVIIVIILWRRKKGPSSSSTTHNNKQDDTDIYLNRESTLGNTKPNPNSKEVTYYSNELTPYNIHATVEQSKNSNETASSDSCTANSDHNCYRSQQKKPQFSPYLSYTEAAIDNDAGLDSQSSSDVNNGQGMTASTPDPSAKATYYNFLSETGQDPSEVVKTSSG